MNQLKPLHENLSRTRNAAPHMKIIITAMLVLAVNTLGQAQTASLYVHAMANIYGAGHLVAPAPAGGGEGLMPSQMQFPAGANFVITITNTTGSIRLDANHSLKEADGNDSFTTDLSSYGGISGIKAPSVGCLVGVFTSDDAQSNPPPPTLDFTLAGLGTGFTSLAPQLNQLFLLGDGRTGTATGARQVFHVPTNATRFYLGFADGVNFTGLPGNYSDNTGNLIVTFVWRQVPKPLIQTFTQSGMNILATGTNGLPMATFHLLTHTNLMESQSNWTTIATGQFALNGTFTALTPTNPALPEQYFLIQIP
jgi:hypothetical protein